ncbi:MAG: cupin domain-containing protein [Thermodesulfobacteriota bacterium]|nr:cupin domain-containing protein [Thermodesulfobacteriota bacterium]
MKTAYDEILPYTTKDGSVVRELMHPAVHGNQNQSLAEAVVLPGSTTVLHRHHQGEEIYHITAGQGEMTLGKERFPVRPGDTVCILPGLWHRIRNTGQGPLKLLCCSTPPYAHEDTQLLQKEASSVPIPS